MNDQQIKSFLEAAKTANFTKAAENLGLSQQALSRYITSLETELGVPLFERKNTRNVSLSEEGKVYFSLMQRLEAEFRYTQSHMRTAPQTIRFGYNAGWNLSFMIPQIIKTCREQLPGLDIQLKCLTVNELTEALCSHELDAILTISTYLEPYPELIREPVTSIHRRIFYSELLAFPKDIHSPADLSNETFFLHDDPFVRQMLPQIEYLFTSSYHFVPRFQFVDSLEMIITNVENGQGVAMLDEWVSGMLSSPEFHSVEMDSKLSISLAWHSKADCLGITALKDAILGFFEGSPRLYGGGGVNGGIIKKQQIIFVFYIIFVVSVL